MKMWGKKRYCLLVFGVGWERGDALPPPPNSSPKVSSSYDAAPGVVARGGVVEE